MDNLQFKEVVQLGKKVGVLYEFIETIPSEEEWFCENSLQVYRDKGKELLQKGLPLEYVQELLSDLYHAAANEFGIKI